MKITFRERRVGKGREEMSDKTVVAIAPSAGNVGTMTAIAMDWTGFDRVKYVATLGTAAANGKFDMKATECDTVGGTYTDIPGGALTQVTKAAGDLKTERIDVRVNGNKPFHKIVAVVTTAAFPNSVDGRGYGGALFPKVQDGQNVVA
jgi:hypothetical protein